MSKQWKAAGRVLALALALVMCVGLFAGCNDEEITAPTPTVKPSATTPAVSTPKPDVEVQYDKTQFEVSGTTLVKYIGNGGAVTIPDLITTIDEGAFRGCKSVTSIIFPKTVREIKDYAFEGCTGLTGVLTYKDNTLPNNLNYIGDGVFHGCTGITEIALANKIYEMGTNVFEGCTGLTKATLPDQFVDTTKTTYVPAGTFKGCTALTDVTVFTKAERIEDSAFEGCTSLTTFRFPDKAKEIGKNVFAGCTALAEITFSKTLYNIGTNSLNDTAWMKAQIAEATSKATEAPEYIMVGQNAIVACVVPAGDVTLTIPDNAYAIAEGAFDAFMNRIVKVEFTPSSRMTHFGPNIFKGAVKLTSFELPSKVQVLSYGLFDGCTKLASINTTKNKLTYIDDYAFNNCTALKEIYLPDAITYIGDYAFYNCTSLTEILFPDDIVTIGDYAFKNCTNITEFTFTVKLSDVGVQSFDNTAWYNNLSKYTVQPTKNQFHIFGDGVLIKADIFEKTIVIPEEVKSIASFSFNGWTQIADREFYGSSLPKSITIPAGVTRIGEYAFFCCENLETVFISNTVTSIGEKAFYGCKKLTTITIPSSVTTISDYCFYACTGLKEVVLPQNLTSIGQYAFYNCFALEDIQVPASAAVGKDAFTNCPLLSN